MSTQPGRLSSTWAVNTALCLRGLADIPEPTLFGLGASAWYELAGGADGVPALRVHHPERIKQSFYALNVFAMRFNYLSEDAHVQLRDRTRQGASTLITVDGFALPPGFLAATPSSPGYVLDYTLLVHRDEDGSDDDLYWVQGPRDAAPRALGREQLSQAWFQSGAQHPAATLYSHPVARLNWQPAAALAAALRRHCMQMRTSYPTLGPGGLAALHETARLLDGGDCRALAAAAECARHDGGNGMGRDLMAEFVRAAAAALALPLEPVAHRFDQCAGFWDALVQELEAPRPALGALRAALADIVRCETAALAGLEQALAGRRRREEPVPC